MYDTYRRHEANIIVTTIFFQRVVLTPSSMQVCPVSAKVGTGLSFEIPRVSNDDVKDSCDWTEMRVLPLENFV